MKTLTYTGPSVLTFNFVEPQQIPRNGHTLSYRARADGPSEVHRDKQKIWFSSYRGFYRLDGASRVHPKRHEWWVGSSDKTKDFMKWCEAHEIDFNEIPEDMQLPLSVELM